MNYKIKIIFLISSLTFFSLFLLIGFYSYPQEDALILYRYSSNLAETGQIVFNPNGIRTEGATDFLWMILLGILIYLVLISKFKIFDDYDKELLRKINLPFFKKLINYI